MLLNLLTDKTGSALSRALDAYAVRHRVIANNIANAETPGFTRSEALFESNLRAALETPSINAAKRRIAEVRAEVRPDNQSPRRPDGNNVSIDREITDLTKNTLSYRAAVTLMEIKSAMVRYAITEGRR